MNREIRLAEFVQWRRQSNRQHAGHGSGGYGIAVFSLFATSLQCALLGALLTLSGVAWYPDYPDLADQQWAGLVMWVPAGFVYTGAAIAFLVACLRESEAKTQRWERSLAP